MNTNLLSIDHEIFNAMRLDLNAALQHIMMEMEKRSAEDAALTLKLDVFKREEYVPAVDTYMSDRSTTVDSLKFAYKITSSIQSKSETKGYTPNGYMVEYDTINECFRTKKIEDAQMSMFAEE